MSINEGIRGARGPSRALVNSFFKLVPGSGYERCRLWKSLNVNAKSGSGEVDTKYVRGSEGVLGVVNILINVKAEVRLVWRG